MPNDSCLRPLSAGPCAIVIFGATGDLAKRKLFPSLYNLAALGILPANFSIIGLAKDEMTRDEFQAQMTKSIAEFGTQKIDSQLWQRFKDRLFYHQGVFEDPATYKHLKELLGQSE